MGINREFLTINNFTILKLSLLILLSQDVDGIRGINDNILLIISNYGYLTNFSQILSAVTILVSTQN